MWTRYWKSTTVTAATDAGTVTVREVEELNPILELKNITKVFPGVKALDNVSLTFEKGEIHAIAEKTSRKVYFYKDYHWCDTADAGEYIF